VREFPVENLESRMPPNMQIGTVTMPYDGSLSAGVYDSQGHLVRTLLAASPQKAGAVPLIWDGRNDVGESVSQAGIYTWKGLINQVQVIDEGSVGDSLVLPPKKYPTVGALSDTGQAEMNERIRSVAVDPDDDSIYFHSKVEEGAGSLVKYDQNGNPQWSSGTYYGSGITVDSSYVYTGNYNDDGTSVIYRLNADNGAWVDVVGSQPKPFIIVNPNAIDDFENGTGGSGGTYWANNWSLTGSALIIGNGSESWDDPRGNYHLRLAGNDGVAIRQVNLRGGANVHLAFEFKRHNFAGGDSAIVEVHNGTTWQTVKTLNTTTIEDGDNYTDVDIDLSSYNLPANFQVRFKSQMGAADRYAYFDNARTVYNPMPSDMAYNSISQERQLMATLNMATDATRLYVSNYRLDTIDIYNKSDGAFLGSFSGGANYNPLGIAIKNGNIYVANSDTGSSNGKITRYTYNGGTLTGGTDIITGLNDPGGIDFGGASDHLFVGETGTGKIREYQVTPTVTLAGLGSSFGSLHQPGPIDNEEFTFIADAQQASIAVDSDGILTVVDLRRVQRFNTASGTASLFQSWQGQYSGAPTGAYGFHSGTENGVPYQRYYMLDSYPGSAAFEYEVEVGYTGGQRAGWLGDGSWRLVARYENLEGVAMHRTIWDATAGVNREFIYTLSLRQAQGPTDMNVIAYAVNGGSTRRAAIVGANWAGASRLEKGQGGQFVWTDTDEDGLIDWPGGGSGTSGEVTWYIPKDQTPETNNSAPWVDDSGNIWFIEFDGDVVKVPLNGFDADGNPRYYFTDPDGAGPLQGKQTIIPNDPNLRITTLRVAPNGDIYATAAVPALGTGLGIGGDANFVVHFESNGVLLSKAPTPGSNMMTGDYVEDLDGDPDYFFGVGGISNQQAIHMYSDDGLLVTKHGIGAAGGYWGGWTDYLYGFDAFKHPTTGKIYSYAQDIIWSRSERYRYDNVDTIQRTQGDFTWSAAAADPRGVWTFDGNLVNMTGGNDATIGVGTVSYPAGKIGSALSLNGSSYVTMNYIPQSPLLSYTISAWVNPSSLANSTIVYRATADYTNAAAEIRIKHNGAGYRFEGLAYNGGVYPTITSGSNLSTSTWYHVALTVQQNGQMRLYVNGVEQAGSVNVGNTAIGPNYDRIAVGEGAVGSANFTGLVDDMRIYESALNSTQISAMYNSGTGGFPVVKVTATDPVATEAAGNPGAFTITRNGPTSSALTVNYLLAGSATNGSDYSLPGSVTIPSGSSSVVVTVTPTDDSVFDVGESVILKLVPNNNYSPMVPHVVISPGNVVNYPVDPTVTIVDNESVTFANDPNWTGFGNTISGNDYHWSNSGNAGGSAGEIGGTFARNDDESYYADTNLDRKYTLDDVIKGSGKFTTSNSTTMDGSWFVGHLTSDPSNFSMLGIEFRENGANEVRWTLKMGNPIAKLDTGYNLTSDAKVLPHCDYNFEYSYVPTGGTDNLGVFTARIYNDGYDEVIMRNVGHHRFTPNVYDAFGVGIRGDSAGDNSNNTVQFFAADVNYTGKKNQSANLRRASMPPATLLPKLSRTTACFHYPLQTTISTSTTCGL
jgi:hypothetical protein